MDSYIDQAYQNDVSVNANIQTLSNPEAIRSVFPNTAKLGLSDTARGFLNRDGGWAFASQGIQRMMEKVTALGGKIVAGKPVSSLSRTDGKVSAVCCVDGSVYEADIVVLAAGSWSASSFPDLGLDGQCLATGYVAAVPRVY